MYTMIPFRSHPTTNRWLDDRFFRSFFDMSDSLGNVGFRVDIREEADAYQLEAELPGVKQDQIELTVENDVLTITANMNAEKRAEQDDKYLYSERRVGHFQRSFNLEGITQEQIEAQYHDGVLCIKLPKQQPQAQRAQRKIDIQG